MQYKSIFAVLPAMIIALSMSACTPVAHEIKPTNSGTLWVQTSAEYEALSLQAYRAASEDLGKFIADPSWSALPGQVDAGDLPLAIIADMDETVISNVAFQASFVPPFKDSKLNDWDSANTAEPVPGVVPFLRRAQASGVEIFIATNRPCEAEAGAEDSCPYKSVVLQNLREIGLEVDAEHVSLANERPEWGKEKLSRRNHIAKTHRVIMLLGDDLVDFIPCSRKKRLHPCTEGATIASRHAATVEFDKYWGEGWYILPNPMHGSWTTVK